MTSGVEWYDVASKMVFHYSAFRGIRDSILARPVDKLLNFSVEQTFHLRSIFEIIRTYLYARNNNYYVHYYLIILYVKKYIIYQYTLLRRAALTFKIRGWLRRLAMCVGQGYLSEQ